MNLFTLIKYGTYLAQLLTALESLKKDGDTGTFQIKGITYKGHSYEMDPTTIRRVR